MLPSFFLAVYLASVPIIDAKAAETMNLIEADIKPVIQFAMDWAMQAGMAITGTHAFIVLCKRFID